MTAEAALLGAVSVIAPSTVSPKLAVFEVPTGVDWLAVSVAVMLTFGVAGNGPALDTEAEEQLYVALASVHDHVPGAETTVAFAA
ncbi:MAG TPA: hypothetical protein VNU84_05850 [Candidatus Acidoferrum sp.]|jgi:hypothetical protein|nr:hypothetical protein [Candidatus Acidoferrum sp.]